ncbi:WxL domain-containing protein [Listeria aquatica]|uniref:Cell surface protein with WxL domain n=1 Tax=Listeria aquatica FSL S10-1188 TaxID=1265818 RepID=W7AP54_9LIST|nr:WxL domain-containing protein [Listeria aquatica]EUJ16959.1 cell surface protein with WxL domain [Listeria aquatica FSL S10-1188]
MKLHKWIGMGSAAGMIFAIPVSAFAADGAEYQSNGVVQFVPSTGITKPMNPDDPQGETITPVDPTTPEGLAEPGTSGPLSIDFASSIDFGTNEITARDETYYAKAQKFNQVDGSTGWTSNFVQVSDHRGTNLGWMLTVKQEGQFSNADTQNKELVGAQIKFTDSQVVSNAEGMQAPDAKDIVLDPAGAESTVMSAQIHKGAGSWIDKWGSVSEEPATEGSDAEATKVNKAISLFIPGKSAKDAVQYKTKLTWKLSDVPGNDK